MAPSAPQAPPHPLTVCGPSIVRVALSLRLMKPSPPASYTPKRPAPLPDPSTTPAGPPVVDLSPSEAGPSSRDPKPTRPVPPPHPIMEVEAPPAHASAMPLPDAIGVLSVGEPRDANPAPPEPRVVLALPTTAPPSGLPSMAMVAAAGDGLGEVSGAVFRVCKPPRPSQTVPVKVLHPLVPPRYPSGPWPCNQ